MRDTSRPLPFAQGTRAVFDLSLDAMVWSRRTLLMGILVGLPALVAVAYRVVLATHPAARMPSADDIYAVIVAVYWIRNVLPLAALFFATALVADEVEGRTLTYLLTRPLSRASIFAGKFAAYLATTLALALPSVVLTYFVLLSARGWAAVAASVGDLFRDVGVAALTLVAYGAFFALLGVLLKRPVIPGLLFLYGWELMANLPGYLPRFTLTAWLRSLIRHHPAEEGLAGLFQQVLPVEQALPVLVIVSAAFLAAAVSIFSTREYVLEQ
jgi:ABC-type transport system involved in multi-copper enzyme maturation permease subunit